MPNDPDATRIYFLAPRSAAAEGIVTVPVDFAHLFSLIPRVGRNATMLYVTLRALRQTAGMGSFKVDDLVWLLRARPWRIWWWMHKLSKERLLVYRLANGYFTDVLVFQVAARPTMGREYDVPAHWFEHVLPLHSRTRFLVYLYVRSHEWGGDIASVSEERMIRDLRLPALRLRWHIWRLHRAGLVVRARGEHVVRDPEPASIVEHGEVRLRELNILGWPMFRLGLAVLIAVACLLILYLLH
ncbi:MAG TPA: hypothetical protein VJ276_18020 [Thermoanaerobaculia bacterium]|nr:hypothetical protein [Thermoanaerobaculia bacterium]